MATETRLRRAAAETDPAIRTLKAAAVVAEQLRQAGARPVLVGGAAVEIYTRAAYTTRDLDFVASSGAATDAALAKMGFQRHGRGYVHLELGIVVELPGSVLAPARSTSLEVEGMRLDLICVEDLIVDRLAAWKHWNWDADGAAAALLLALHPDLDRKRLRQRARQEDVADALAELSSEIETGGGPIDRVTLQRISRSFGRYLNRPEDEQTS